MKKAVITALLCGVLVLTAAVVSDMLGVKERTIYAMDTVMTIKIKGSPHILDEIENMIYEYDSLLSAHNPESEVYRLNSTGDIEASARTVDVIRLGIEYTRLTGGGFDITLKALSDLWNREEVPSDEEIHKALSVCGVDNIVISGNRVTLKNGVQIDLGGIAKGYIADRAREIIKENKINYAILDLGGNVYVLGEKDMKVGIQKPFSARGEVACAVEVNDKTVISSGTYERYFEKDGVRYHHILDKNSGRPADSGAASVTIIGGDGALCDALSTAGVVLGEGWLKDMKNKSGSFEYIVIYDDGEIEGSAEYEL